MHRWIGIVLLIPVLGGCGDYQSRGFSLPLGDAEQGRQTFVELGCNICHSVQGRRGETDIARNQELATDIHVQLGGKVGKVKTYGELVTSIINPSHRIAPGYQNERFMMDGHSRMPNFNSGMTVEELVNLVTFLETEYEIEVVRTPYPTYPAYF